MCRAQTAQLEQLLAVTLNRSLPDYKTTTIFSPANGGVCLNPRITFRRLPMTNIKTGEKTLPAVVAQIFQNGQSVSEIRFEAGRDSLAWNDIPLLPERFQDGLPPGNYSLRIDGTPEKEHRFSVASAEDRAWMASRFAGYESLLGRDDPITIQIEAETLIQDNDGGPFYSDALDRLTAIPKDDRTPYLASLERFLCLRMTDGQGMVRGSDGRLEKDSQERTEEKKADEDPVAAAELIHRLLLNEKWAVASSRMEAFEQLLQSDKKLPEWKHRELEALIHLYRGMIFAESGVARSAEAKQEFDETTTRLDALAAMGTDEAKAIALSRFRAANNSGNFYLRLAQDRLYNHALALATGGTDVWSDLLKNWAKAQDAYQKSLRISDEFLQNQPEWEATAKINLARLYSLLGDVVRTLDREKTVFEIETGAYATAARFVGEVLEKRLDEDRLNAVAHHLLADIAFRREDKATCRTEAEAARQAYVRTGTLSGVEAVERLLGILETDDTDTALKHLSISNLLSEVLREQIPADQIGLSRAGFFARRAYVSERMIQLLLESNRPLEALQILENSKAGTLHDVLAQSGISDHVAFEDPRSISTIFENWPKDTVAIEYFLGSKNCWGFLVSSDGVEAFPLIDSNKNCIRAKDIVSAIRDIQNNFVFGKEMMRAVTRKKAYDHSWHDHLHSMTKMVLPLEILHKIQEKKPDKLLVIPHHALHYLPFAALVIEPDTSERQSFTMLTPKFLIDEPFCIFYAPSLTFWDALRCSPARPISQISIVAITEQSGLKNIEKEIEGIVDSFSSDDRIDLNLLLENKVNRQAVLSLLPLRGMLFLGMHGNVCPDSPLDGDLVLYDNERLTARDVFSATVGVDLVVMGACFSGLADRDPLPGDDLFGLQRAFLHQGSKTVISSVWDIKDVVSPFLICGMIKKMRQGIPAIRALSESQKEYLDSLREDAKNGKNSIWLHPYAWAVYIATGDDRTCFLQE